MVCVFRCWGAAGFPLFACSIGRHRGQWAWEDSNLRPHPYQGCALTKLSYKPGRTGEDSRDGEGSSGVDR
jgi:hypothetical protein